MIKGSNKCMNSAFEFFRRGGIVDFHCDVNLSKNSTRKRWIPYSDAKFLP